MSKFNVAAARPVGRGPLAAEERPSGRTHEGAPGFARDTKTELFLLAVSNMVGENTMYETGRERDSRFTHLVHQVAVADPEWFTSFVRWLRTEAHMRSASLVAGLEGAKARLAAGEHGHSRRMVGAALQRADEPGEALAYWTSRYGRAIPKPIKRGIADAAARLYTERSMIKYDTGSKGFRFGDVCELTHPTPSRAWQGPLFDYAITRRQDRGLIPDPDELPVLARNSAIGEFVEHNPDILLAPDELNAAGLTWENALSLAGNKVDKAKLWEALIPSMGYMALVRNLRNFDQAGVSDTWAARVASKLTDPDEVAKSRQLPFRFLAAYNQAPSLRWSYPLEQALGHSLANVPALPGRTLVLVDRSPSMWMYKLSEHSTMDWADAAAVFGAALALRAEHADLVWFAARSARTEFQRGESVLTVIKRLGRDGGTDIPAAVHEHLRPHHDRVVIVTDEQTRAGWLPSNVQARGGWAPTRTDDLIPQRTPLYMWNLAGYTHGVAPAGQTNRHLLGGLNDQAFALIPLIEAGRVAAWPWEHNRG